jgi:hypothetical protein
MPGWQQRRVELTCALSNPANRTKLAGLHALRRRLLKDAPARIPVTTHPPRRAGDLTRAVHIVLAASEGSMRVSEVHQAVEELLQRPVNLSSVKGRLSEGALGDGPVFRRVAWGRYQLPDAARSCDASRSRRP